MRCPEQVIEVSHPHLQKLGVDPEQFSFLAYAQVGDPNEWNQSGIEFPEVLEGTMYMYIPSRWKMELKQSNLAQVMEGEKVRLTMILTSRDEWRMTLPEFFNVGEVSAYAYYPVQSPHYDKWIACIDRDKRMWIYTFYRAGDWLQLLRATLADATHWCCTYPPRCTSALVQLDVGRTSYLMWYHI